METEALLSALSDSQNLNKVLREENVRMREENSQLRERLAVLEETVEAMRRERDRGRERERLSDSRPHSRNQSTYGHSSSRPHMSRFGGLEHVGLGRATSSLEGIYKRSYVSSTSHPHTAYLSHADEYATDTFPLKGKSKAGSRLGTASTLGSELDLVSLESSLGEMVGHRRISPDHRATFMDDQTTLSRTRNGSGHGDRARSTASGPALGHRHPSRRFEADMERATLKGASGLGVGFGGRRAVSDTLSQRSLRESSSRSNSRPHSRPDPDAEQDDREDDEDETRRFQRLLRKSSGHLRTHSTSSSVFGAPPSNMSMLMHSSSNTDDEGFLDADETRRDLRPHPPPPSAGGHEGDASAGNVSNVSPTTAGFSMSQPGSPGSLRLRSDHEDHLGDMESLHLDHDSDLS